MEKESPDSRCDGCPNNPVRTVAAHGAVPARVLMLAGAPRHHDEHNGRAFMSPLFVWLQENLAAAGIAPETVHYATLVACRPPHQRPLRADEIAACASRLEALLVDTSPEVILLCGADALAAVMPGATLGVVHGRVFNVAGRFYIPIRHPYTTIHHDPYVAELRDDLSHVASLLEAGSFGAVATEYVAPPGAVQAVVPVSVAHDVSEQPETPIVEVDIPATEAAAVEPATEAPPATAAESEPSADEKATEEPAEETVTPAQLSLF